MPIIKILNHCMVQYTQQNFSTENKLIYAWFEAMYTRIDIVLCTPIHRDDLVEMLTEMEAEVRKYEGIGNRFDPQSEISNVNRFAFESEMTISDELCNLLIECHLHTEKTQGYFDVSIYSNSNFQSNTKAFLINSDSKSIQFSHAGVFLDLSGFLKGYVLGKLIEIADKNEMKDMLINVGNSSIYAKGNHPFGRGWKIKIPETDSEIVLHDECLTTSGNTELTKWPIMNPINGEVINNKKAVSVITKLPGQGEVLSKASYLAPPIELNNILKQYKAKIVSSNCTS